MPSEMAIMIIGKPTHKYKKINSKHLTWWQHQIWEHGTTSNTCCNKISHGNTPWDDVIHVHLGVDVVNFHNKQVEVDSLDQHPAKGSHQEILHQSCYCDTSSLQKEICFFFVLFFFCFGRKIWLIKWKDRRSLSPCVLWRLLLREKLAVQLRGTQKDSIEFETKVDGRLWSNERWRKKKVKTKTKHGFKKNKHNQNKNNSNKKLRKKRKTNKTRQTPKKINQKLQNQKENKKPSWYRIRKH